MEITESKEKKKDGRKANRRELWDTIKKINISIEEVTEGKERKGKRKYLKK